jgi:hypothetical protein
MRLEKAMTTFDVYKNENHDKLHFLTNILGGYELLDNEHSSELVFRVALPLT